ncbi:MAG: hypothetical protein NVSMB49_23390 [Ktedonobacteraceae bacterium]
MAWKTWRSEETTYCFPCTEDAIHHTPTIAESYLPHEDTVAHRWWSLSSEAELPLMNGGTCQLVFSGRSGGPAGPDVRDAVLVFTEAGEHRFGDVEFHVRASDWVSHKHFTDPRYNNVILHVVLLCDDLYPTTRQDGYHVPVCSLNDIPIAFNALEANIDNVRWPCHSIMHNLSAVEREKLLQRAGLLRFEQKIHSFIEQLHAMESEGHSAASFYNTCLLLALAEGLAYGRDRAFFRAAGQRLLGQSSFIPEPLGHAPAPSPLDVRRLNVLRKLVAKKQDVWESLKQIFLTISEDALLQNLRKYFRTHGLSLARTDILLCNVIFPFAAAIALLEHNFVLGERAQRLYETHPGLSSNTVTRMMSTQLLLPDEPSGSCCQQGLHYIYQQTCQAKHCAECMMGRRIV